MLREAKRSDSFSKWFFSISLGCAPFDALAEWDAANACASQRQERVFFLGLKRQSCNYRGPFGGGKERKNMEGA